MSDTARLILEKNVPVPMRDGIRLYADIYRPDDGRRHPVLLLRTPYNKEDAQTMNYAHPSWYARHGYVVIVQDTRGRWASEGDFHPYADDGQDGYDTIEWAASLPYTVPKVGMYGFSYAGAVQWLAAANRPPHLTCITPAMTGSDSYQGKTYRNGAFALACTQSWVLFVAQDTALRKGRTDWAETLRLSCTPPLRPKIPILSPSLSMCIPTAERTTLQKGSFGQVTETGWSVRSRCLRTAL